MACSLLAACRMFARHQVIDAPNRRGNGGGGGYTPYTKPFFFFVASPSSAVSRTQNSEPGVCTASETAVTVGFDETYTYGTPRRIERISSSSLAASVMNDPWRARSLRRISTSFLACGSLSAADLGCSSLGKRKRGIVVVGTERRRGGGGDFRLFRHQTTQGLKHIGQSGNLQEHSAGSQVWKKLSRGGSEGQKNTSR